MENALFKKDEDWKRNAWISKGPTPLSVMSEGYYMGGDIITQKILEEGSDQDYLVYPICYLFRHFVELKLKDIIRDARKAKGKAPEVPVGHDLNRLWTTACDLVQTLFKKGDSSESKFISDHDYESASQLIDCLHKADERSVSFRYAANKENTPYLEEFDIISISNFRDRITSLRALFQKMSGGLDYYLTLRNEKDNV